METRFFFGKRSQNSKTKILTLTGQDKALRLTAAWAGMNSPFERIKNEHMNHSWFPGNAAPSQALPRYP